MVAVGPLSNNKDQSLVQIRKAGKTYRSKRGDVVALKDIDLDIGMSEFVSVLGPSGCGKSTLLRCLAGLDHPTSGGMRQRVSICRALLMNPKLLLMDEPFGALDAMTRDDLNVELQRVWMADEKTVFFVTHSITEAIFLADRVVIMTPSPGRIAEIIKVDLPRPRDLSIRETPEFGQMSRRARLLFQEMGVIRGGRGDKLRVAS